MNTIIIPKYAKIKNYRTMTKEKKILLTKEKKCIN